MHPIRLGVIGLGLIWIREHQPMLSQLQAVFTPVALCDLNENARQAAAQHFPNATLFADPNDLLASDEVDVVLVLTPIAFNAPTALAALNAGKDVIMEKPIARSVAEGRALIDAARKANRRLFVLEQSAYRQADVQLAQVIASGEIGDLVLWNRIQHAEADSAPAPLRYATTPWRKEADFPLGTLFDGGIHLLASLNEIFGPPSSVFATGQKLRPDYGEYDQVTMHFRYPNGATGLVSHSSCLPRHQNHFHLHGRAGVIVVESDRLVIEKSGQAPRVIETPTENARYNLWQAIVQALQTGSEPAYSAEKALRDVLILETVNRSIRSEQQLPIPL